VGFGNQQQDVIHPLKEKKVMHLEQVGPVVSNEEKNY
jgi:hypothetical protein